MGTGELGKAKQMKNKTPTGNPSAFEIVSQFVAALQAQDTAKMKSLQAKDYKVD